MGRHPLLGLIIQRVTGHSWRREATRRVIRPLRLTRTHVPAPGQRSVKGPHAHGYVELDGRLTDVKADPSFAGPAGGYALASTVQDLARFLDALFAGRLFRHRATLKHMLHMRPAQGERPRRLRARDRAARPPCAAELIGHLGGAVFRTYVGRLPPRA